MGSICWGLNILTSKIIFLKIILNQINFIKILNFNRKKFWSPPQEQLKCGSLPPPSPFLFWTQNQKETKANKKVTCKNKKVEFIQGFGTPLPLRNILTRRNVQLLCQFPVHPQ